MLRSWLYFYFLYLFYTEVPLSMAYCHDIENFVDQACKEKGINREEYDTIIETDDGKDVV